MSRRRVIGPVGIFAIAWVGLACIDDDLVLFPASSDPTDDTDAMVPAMIQLIAPRAKLTWIGDTTTVEATGVDGRGRPLTAAYFSWWSSDSSIVSVVAGSVTARGPGAATITATAEGDTAAVLLTVEQVPVLFEASEDSLLFDLLGESASLSYAAADSGAAPIELTDVVWTSTDPSIVSVDTSGTVEARAGGRALVLASSGGLVDSVDVIVATLEAFPGEWALIRAERNDARLGGVSATLSVQAGGRYRAWFSDGVNTGTVESAVYSVGRGRIDTNIDAALRSDGPSSGVLIGGAPAWSAEVRADVDAFNRYGRTALLFTLSGRMIGFINADTLTLEQSTTRLTYVRR